MKLGVMRFFIAAATAVLLVVAGSTAASAQCTSPNYNPDFQNVSNNQSCLTLNNNGAYPGYPGFYPVVNSPTPPTGVTTVLRLTPNQFFAAGSAWYNTQQPVAGAFSTTFTFQLSGTTEGGSGNADGIAFVIQNSPPVTPTVPPTPPGGGTNALGPDGCGIGFGDDTQIGCTPSTGGIPNSLTVELNTYQNSGIDPSSSDITIQNCLGTGPNSVDPGCTIAVHDLTQLTTPINMADGNVHSVTITYSGPTTTLLDVIIDGVDLFPGGVSFNIASIGLASGNSCSNCLAWVGFTAATGGGDDNQDILSWTFTPQAQTAVVAQGVTSTLSFPNASGNNVYSYTAVLTAPYATPAVTVQPILLTQAACDALVQVNFPTARCFVYQNAENTGLDESVVFAVTCPEASGGMCGSNLYPFDATLGTGFSFLYSDNPLFVYPGLDLIVNPLPGWVKWPLPPSPTPVSPISPPAKGSMSNQIVSFSVVADPGGKTVGGSGGGASYWVATYDMADEVGPGLQAGPGITITSPSSSATYNPNTTVAATYTCSNPSTSQPLSSPTGPYLKAASCTQATGTQTSCSFTPIVGPGNLGGLSCTGTFVTPSKKGTYIFGVTGVDSGGNQNLGAVTYKVN